MVYVQPLDLQTLLVNNLAGSMTVFAALAIITIAALAARFRMNNMMLWIMLGAFAGIMCIWLPALWALATFIGMLGIGFMIAKLIKQ